MSSKKLVDSKPPPRERRAAAYVEALDGSKNQYGPAAGRAKRAALGALTGLPIEDPATLLRYHEALCFLRAYPDDLEVLGLVEAALETFGVRVARLGARAGVLDETGVAGTAVCCALSHAAARWVAGRFPAAVEIDWDDADAEERLGILLPSLLSSADEEALVEADVPSREWLAAATGADERSHLAWVLERLARRPREARTLYDAQQVRTRWELGDGPASRTLARLRGPRPFFHQRGLIRWRGSLRRRLPGPPVTLRAASPDEAESLIDAARAAVIVRYREVHAFNFADPAAVLLADVGRGVRVAWLGVLPAHRLPLRAHFGYLLLKNGAPVGYGDASCLFDWVEIAYNVFESFRQGESAFVFGRLLAFLYQRFGVRAVHLSRYQIGHDNEEALASGAFWFYYKLGFRPKRRDLARLAAAERRAIARDRGHRSSQATLARLAEDGMFLGLGGAADRAVSVFDVRRVGLAAARVAASRGRGLLATVAQSLGAGGWRRWPLAERRTFVRVAPFVAAIPDLAAWPPRDRRAFVGVIRAKGGPSEAEYLRRLRAHRRLRRSVLALGGPA